MAVVAHKVLTMTLNAASGDAINPQMEKPVRDGLGTRISARFACVGLETPLPELHEDIGQHVPSWPPLAAAVTRKVK